MESGILFFWAVAGAMALAAGLILWRAVQRAGDGPGDGSAEGAPDVQGTRAADLAVYRDQLAEVGRDVARGTIAPDEAERLRTEIARRILEADRANRAESAASTGGGRLWAGAAIAVALAGAVWAYDWLGVPGYPDVPLAERIARAEALRAGRPSQAEAVADLPAAPLNDPEDPEMADLIARLRSAVAERPDDRRGLELLVENEARLGNAGAVADAMAKLVAAKGAEATAGDYAALADALVRQARGYVSPEAGTAVAEALKRDPGNGTARFYAGLLEAQIGRPDLAFRLWSPLLAASPPDAPWVPVIRAQIESIAAAAGVDYALPPEGGGAGGPTAADVAASADMSPEERAEMIRGMVEGLSARLGTEGGTGAEWAQLITALGVLGETDRARAIWDEAQNVFAASPDDLERVAAAARAAGVAE